MLAAPVQDGRKRPQPGGRFPSDIAVEKLSERGLHAPLSASSGSSGEYGDVKDRSIAAASGLPGSGVGQHFVEERGPGVSQQYGDGPTGDVGMHYVEQPDSPTHAQMVTQQAEDDGINPYTLQRLSMEENHQRSPAVVAAAGLAGARVGAAGMEVSAMLLSSNTAN